MNYTKTFSLFVLLSALLHLLSGCSNVDNIEDDKKQQNIPVKDIHVVYEANPRVFSSSESLKAISGRLEDIKSLGTDILWLMPIFEQGTVNAIGSPYCVKNYKKVNPSYGTTEDLKALVSKAHSMDMKVILDWVANHTAWDNEWTNNKSWYTQDAGGNIVSPIGTGWNDVADLNYGSKEMRAAMLEAMQYWVKETDIDGFRCDYAEGVPHDFWSESIISLRKIKGDGLIMLAESSSKSFYSDGFDMSYSWNFPYVLSKVFKGTSSVSDFAEENTSDAADVPEEKYRMRYITNHDMMSSESLVSAFGSADGALAAFVITSMLSDCVMIYSSQEIGYPNTINFFKDNVMDWNSNADYFKSYKDYMRLWLKTAELRNGKPLRYETGKAVTLYWSNNDGKGLFTIVNTTGKKLSTKMPMERVGDKMKNAATGAETVIPSSMDLEPYQYLIFEK